MTIYPVSLEIENPPGIAMVRLPVVQQHLKA